MSNNLKNNPIRIDTPGATSWTAEGFKIQSISWENMYSGSSVNIQNFSGTVAIWQSVAPSDFVERSVTYPKGLPVQGLNTVVLGSGVVFIYTTGD